MFEALRKYKYFLITIVILVLAFIGYQAWFKGEEEELLITTGGQGGTTVAASSRIITLLNDLRSVTLDNALFNDPVFQSLQEFPLPQVSEAVGRSNPFAPSPGIVQPSR